MYQAIFKRVIDIILSCFAFLMLSPLFLLIALLILIFDFGPIFFTQKRVGRNGAEFEFYKFRSMPVGTKNLPSDQLHQVQLTWIGKLIRRTNIDELPQLLNILRGDMSIVGPRPSLPTQTGLIALRKSNTALYLRPGLTGLAQVNSFDGMSIEQKAVFDGQYAADVSFLGDIKIILSTVLYLFKPPPVY